MQKETMLDMLTQNRATCTSAFDQVTPEKIDLQLNEQAASVGFIYRHIGETMNLFGLFLGLPTNVQNTTMGQADNGQGRDIEASRQLVEQGYAMLQHYVENTPDAAWLGLTVLTLPFLVRCPEPDFSLISFITIRTILGKFL